MFNLIIQSLFTVFFFYFTLYHVSHCRFPDYHWCLAAGISVVIVALICRNPSHMWIANLYLIFSAAVFISWKTQKIFLSTGFVVLSMLILIVSLQTALYVNVMSGYDLTPISEDVFQPGLHYILAAVMTIVISGVAASVIQKQKSILLFHMHKKHAAYLLSGIFIVFAYFYYQAFIAPITESKKVDISVSSVISIFLLLFFFISVYILLDGIRNSLENAQKQDVLGQLQSYITILESNSGDIKQFRHDYLNIIMALYGFIEAGDMLRLENYFTKYIVPIRGRMKSSNIALDNLSNITMLELKGILTLKLMQAQDLGVQVHIEAAESIESINFFVIDLIKVIGILIDNALEACLEAEIPVLRIAFIKNDRVKTVLITNSFQPPLPPIEDMFRKGFSTKGEQRGLGLSMVRELIDQNENSLMNTFIRNDEFIQELKFMDE